MNKNIYGVLNAEKMERFCEHFRIDSSDLDVNFEGWGKVALLTDEMVFLFPRTPNGAKRMEDEITIYSFLNDNSLPFIPQLVEVVRNQEISYYPFMAVKRIHGRLFTDCIENVSLESFVTFLENLARDIASYHTLDISTLPNLLSKEVQSEDVSSFISRFLSGECIYDLLQELEHMVSDAIGARYQLFPEERQYDKAVHLMEKIRELPDVLIHYDLHEGQIIVDEHNPTTINGIIDWESARVGNPILDFNFFQWCVGISNWNTHFPVLREHMWRAYTKARSFKLSSPHGLDLIYTLAELSVILEQHEKKTIPITGLSFQESLDEYKLRVNNIGRLLVE